MGPLSETLAFLEPQFFMLTLAIYRYEYSFVDILYIYECDSLIMYHYQHQYFEQLISNISCNQTLSSVIPLLPPPPKSSLFRADSGPQGLYAHTYSSCAPFYVLIRGYIAAQSLILWDISANLTLCRLMGFEYFSKSKYALYQQLN